LDATLSTARSQVTGAAEYIATRRGGIGDAARTRLAEAERQLEQAHRLAGSDPVTALAAASQALTLAGRAQELARSEVAAQEARLHQTAWSDGEDGAGLGGILGDWLFSGGGGYSGGWSGGSSRSSWGGSSRSSSRSSWGGSSRRSSRSGSFGGSRRSGGGRSRGGRF
ncbi:MAG TPA: TPM domain-containing protein, partial [Rhodoglobus sp.]|nr:TPM domain-containing protein [Rhodoglobus sp.]